MLESVVVIETRNGALPRYCNEQAEVLSEKYGFFGIGGSDAHSASQIGRCLTEFESDVEDERDLIEVLKTGPYRALYFEEAISDIAERI